ncbi:MAG: hypothetical protein ACODAE_10225 [Gemmatimonadota bacterium]
MIGRRPGYAAAAVLTVAIAVGANTAIFSVVDAVLPRPPPYGEADRLVAVWPVADGCGDDGITTISYPTFRA